jgi:hypothetical protein
MLPINLYAQERLWALERERVDRANQLRAALQLPWKGRRATVRVAFDPGIRRWNLPSNPGRPGRPSGPGPQERCC